MRYQAHEGRGRWRAAFGAIAGVTLFLAACTPTAPGADNTAPVIEALSISPLTVDTSAGSAVMTMTIEISEPESAVASATVNFASPSGGQTLSLSVTPANLVSGDTSSGIYETTATLPQYAEQGTWSAIAAYTVNGPGAFWLLDAATIAANGLTTTFDQTGLGDANAPTLLSIDVNPVTIDTSASGQVVTVTADISDDLAGHNTSTVRFNSPSRGPFVVATFNAANRTAGDALSGTYETTVFLPVGSETGWWTVELASTEDEAGNIDILDAGTIVAAGLDTAFEQVG